MATVESPHTDESLGRSDAFLSFQERLSRVAKVERPVLLIGERGTGKELAAARLHFLSARWQEPLVILNCAALTPSLITTELFGHEAGAFTGAGSRRAGRFEAAHQGTLFLDEIGHIPMEAQEKILRVVEYGSFERVGGTRPVQVDVRLIGATQSDLAGMAEQGRFKRDLLDRLSFEVLYLPPLRKRHGDIPLLATFFATRMAVELNLAEPPLFLPEAIEALEAYPWPGNIRELKNTIERAVYRCDGDSITEVEFDPFFRPAAAPGPAPEAASPERVDLARSLPDAVRDLEIRMLRAALDRSRHNQKKAARLLGLTYHQFRGLYRKHRDGLV